MLFNIDPFTERCWSRAMCCSDVCSHEYYHKKYYSTQKYQ